MKKTKKLAAMIAALTLSACSIAPMFSFAITVDELNDEGKTAWNAYLAENADADINTWWDTVEDKSAYQNTPSEPPVASDVNGTTSFKLSVPAGVKAEQITNIRAYKIFNISSDDTGINIKDNNEYICGYAQEALLNALKLNETDVVTIANAGERLSAIVNDTDSSAKSKELAKKVASSIPDYASSYALATELKDGVVTFNVDLTGGYYVILCDVEGDTTGDPNTNKALSLGMLTVVSNDKNQIGNGEAKVGLPTVQKKVLEDDAITAENYTNAQYETDKQYNDGADWAIGQEGKFKLYGTLPDNYNDYDHYYYEFCDTLGKEFDLCNGLTLKAGITTIELTADDVASLSSTPTEICKGKALTDIWATKSVDAETGAISLNIAIEDMKAFIGEKGENDVITVEYGAKLNGNAVVGKVGQRNAVTLKYSNNPNLDYKPSKDDNPDTPDENGETPKDEVIVFTYALEFEKQFFEGTAPLTNQEIIDGTYDNIEFSLGENVYVRPADKTNPEESKYDYVIVDSSYTGTDKTTKMSLTLVDRNGNVITKEQDNSGQELTESALTNLGAKLVIRIKGLDSAKYKITENIKEGKEFGYNVIDDNTGNVIIENAVQHQQSWDDFASEKIYTEIKNYFDKTKEDLDVENVSVSGTVNGVVENKKGSKLPSTGGIGTTIFYLGGGAMVAVAGVFLITKKRMGKSEN